MGKRLLFVVPQIIGIFTVTFFFVRLIPGDPARLMAGPLVSEEALEAIRQRMGWSGPLPLQFITYVKNAFQGDLGLSWYTGQPVAVDIIARLPATLELLGLALLLTFFVLVPIGLRAVSPGKGLMKRVSQRALFGYGMAAGAFPDFWLGLILIFVFFSMLGWVPAPMGQLDIAVSPPLRITGMYLIDSLLTGNWVVLKSHLAHLILPVFVLTFVYGGGILKIAIVSAVKVEKSGFINFAKVYALPVRLLQAYIRKATYPPVITISAVFFAFLLGGAVLVEQVFSWGGFGQYAVQAVVYSDFAAIQGVVLVAAVVNLVAFILVDVVYFWTDPRIKKMG